MKENSALARWKEKA
jgi:hypothetical protein